MSATSNLPPTGLYHVYNVANDNISADGTLTSRLLDDAHVNGALEPAVWKFSPTNTLESYKIIHATGNELPSSGSPANGVKNLLWRPKEPTEHGQWFIFLLEDPDVYAIYCPRNMTPESDRPGAQVEARHSVMKDEVSKKLAQALEGDSLFENGDDIPDYCCWEIVPTMDIALRVIQYICECSGNVSQFFPYGGEGYKSSVRHYLESSCEIASAAVQPGRVEDLSMILKVLAITKVPFAVKGGGHTTNPGFSSTTGIQISMARFNKISKYVPGAKSRDVEAGCLFDEVYRAIVPTGQNIVGGSGIAGVGIAGWLLGGGYSLKTNQYGLGIDNLLGFRIVLPNGEIENVTEQSNKELFEAVKGGGNNFGIVVEFTLKTHDQSPTVYGGLLVYESEESEDVKNAIVDFVDHPRDPKAVIVAAFRYYNNPKGEEFRLTVQYFYDGPKPSDNPFQKFLDIPHTVLTGRGAGVGMEQTSYTNFDQRFSIVNDLDCDIFELDFDDVEPYANDDESSFTNIKPNINEIRSQAPRRAMAGVGENARGRWGNVMVSKYTRDIINEIERQAKKAAKHLIKKGGKMVVVDIWPFVHEMFDNSSPAAWPHEKGQPNGPFVAIFLWDGEENDAFWIRQMNRAVSAIEAKVYGVGVAPSKAIYSNNTLAERTAVSEVYRQNLDSLRKTRKKYDPDDVMGQAGGFRIPLPAHDRQIPVNGQ